MKELLENHGEGEFYKNIAVKLAVKSRYISRKTMDIRFSTYCGKCLPHYVEKLFHNMWKRNSTVCGREIPRYVEERIMRLFTANSILVCN